MSEASPPKPEEGDRAVATGALRRVFKSRERARSKGKDRMAVTLAADLDASGSDSEEEERGRVAPRNTSNHYTLNLPSAPAPQSDTPYILLGCVHLCIVAYGTIFTADLGTCSSSSTSR